MPYKDPEHERARQRERLARGHGADYLEAADWADKQIATLKALGITHSAVEWQETRRELVRSRLNRATRDALLSTPTYPNPPSLSE